MGKGAKRPSDAQAHPVVVRHTKKGRLRQAIANDNGGVWFLAESRHSVVEIERRFRWGQVGRVLYDRVGGILQGPKHYLYVQIALVEDVLEQNEVTKETYWTSIRVMGDSPEWAVQVCLRDLGVHLVEQHSGGYVTLEVSDVLQGAHY